MLRDLLALNLFVLAPVATRLYILSLPAPLPISGDRRAGPRARRQPRQRSARDWRRARGDRKSTRLNSSHTVTSYAVFCSKKKTRYTFCPEPVARLESNFVCRRQELICDRRNQPL